MNSIIDIDEIPVIVKATIYLKRHQHLGLEPDECFYRPEQQCTWYQ